jgi:hypothetical protein
MSRARVKKYADLVNSLAVRVSDEELDTLKARKEKYHMSYNQQFRLAYKFALENNYFGDSENLLDIEEDL